MLEALFNRFISTQHTILYKNINFVYNSSTKDVVQSYPTIFAGPQQLFETFQHITRCTSDQVNTLEGRWRKIISSKNFTVGISLDGSIWGWGSNLYGQLGIPPENIQNLMMPTPIDTRNIWVDVAVGDNHLIALAREDDSYRVYGVGDNQHRQLGVDHINVVNTSTLIEIHNTEGSVFKPNIFAAGNNTGITTTTGTILYGDNEFYQLSDIRKTHTKELDLPIQGMGPGYFIFKNTTGTYFTCGKNTSMQLGNKTITEYVTLNNVETSVLTNTHNFIDIQCGSNGAVAIDNQNNIWVWGKCADGNTYSTPTNILEEDEWFKAVIGDEFLAAINTEGYTYCLGTIQ